MIIKQILELDKVETYLRDRLLISKYKIAKDKLLQGNLLAVNFKIRQPKNLGIYQFRINKKYRAFGYFEVDTLKIFKISDHQ